MLSTRYRLTRTPNDNDGRVFGTWDFKWPQGAVIRVAFPDWPGGPEDTKLDGIEFAPEGDEETRLLDGRTGYARLTRTVECLARRWLIQGPNIKLEFQHNTVPSSEPRPDDYDVLVSLAALPVFQKRQELLADGTVRTVQKKYFLPGSELGRYAQRIDYGLPTTYLGKREHLAGSVADYFSSPEFRHWVIHEFGHVLGLPHEQQNPNLIGRIQLKPAGDLVKILRTALGYADGPDQDITEAEVEEEIICPWPTLPGAPFCDFRTYRQDDPTDDTASVMFHLYWQRLLAGKSDDAPAVYHERPCTRDLEAVARMYPKRPVANESFHRAA
jgi:hypothetical protein